MGLQKNCKNRIIAEDVCETISVFFSKYYKKRLKLFWLKK